MAEFDPLMQLRDIHLPKEASNWPPAPGWYALLIVVTLISIGICIFIKRHFPIWQTKRHALQLLKSYQKQYLKEQNNQKTCALINELLKKTAFFYYPRSIVASLKGQDWLDFLNSTMRSASIIHKNSTIKSSKLTGDFNLIAKELLEYPYQNSQNLCPQKFNPDFTAKDEGQLKNLFYMASIWIKNQSSFSQKAGRKDV